MIEIDRAHRQNGIHPEEKGVWAGRRFSDQGIADKRDSHSVAGQMIGGSLLIQLQDDIR